MRFEAHYTPSSSPTQATVQDPYYSMENPKHASYTQDTLPCAAPGTSLGAELSVFQVVRERTPVVAAGIR